MNTPVGGRGREKQRTYIARRLARRENRNSVGEGRDRRVREIPGKKGNIFLVNSTLIKQPYYGRVVVRTLDGTQLFPPVCTLPARENKKNTNWSRSIRANRVSVLLLRHMNIANFKGFP